MSEAPGKTRSLHVPSTLFFSLIIFFVVVLPVLVWLISYSYIIKKQKGELAELRNKNRVQAEKMSALSSHIKKIARQLEDLAVFRLEIKAVSHSGKGKIPYELSGMGGGYPSSCLKSNHGDIPYPLSESFARIERYIAVVKNSENELFELLESRKAYLAKIPSRWPVRGYLSSGFGYRRSPFTGKREFHRGIDISARSGTQVTAPADGIVTAVARGNEYGLNITMRHGYGIDTRYAHLKKVFVKKGQFVRRGDVIALVGNSGRSTGPHLHYEIHLNRIAMNPMRFIRHK